MNLAKLFSNSNVLEIFKSSRVEPWPNSSINQSTYKYAKHTWKTLSSAKSNSPNPSKWTSLGDYQWEEHRRRQTLRHRHPAGNPPTTPPADNLTTSPTPYTPKTSTTSSAAHRAVSFPANSPPAAKFRGSGTSTRTFSGGRRGSSRREVAGACRRSGFRWPESLAGGARSFTATCLGWSSTIFEDVGRDQSRRRTRIRRCRRSATTTVCSSALRPSSGSNGYYYLVPI